MISKVFNQTILKSARFYGLKPQGVFRFSQKTWKDRDEAAEKVYITQQQKIAMKKLLEKINEQKIDNKAKMEVFERKLEDMLRRYKVTNQAFKVEVLHLHKQL